MKRPALSFAPALDPRPMDVQLHEALEVARSMDPLEGEGHQLEARREGGQYFAEGRTYHPVNLWRSQSMGMANQLEKALKSGNALVAAWAALQLGQLLVFTNEKQVRLLNQRWNENATKSSTACVPSIRLAVLEAARGVPAGPLRLYAIAKKLRDKGLTMKHGQIEAALRSKQRGRPRKKC